MHNRQIRMKEYNERHRYNYPHIRGMFQSRQKIKLNQGVYMGQIKEKYYEDEDCESGYLPDGLSWKDLRSDIEQCLEAIESEMIEIRTLMGFYEKS